MGNSSSTPSSPPLTTESRRLQPLHQGFNPTRQDVQVAVHILMGLQLRAMPGHLPSELAVSILAHADYRPRIMSSWAEPVYYRSGGSRHHWYLTTPMLPEGFRHVSSITLQVRSEDLMDWGNLGASIPDGMYDHRHSWFEMCILRPLRRAAPPICGGVEWPPSQERMAQTRVPGQSKPDADFSEWNKWLVVNHNGRETWVVRHNSTPVFCRPGEPNGEYVNGIPMRGIPCQRCETYRIDWPGNTSTAEVENPMRGFIDSEGFMSALMPGDKIALFAVAEVSSLILYYTSSIRLIVVCLCRTQRLESRFRRLLLRFCMIFES